MVVGWKDGDNKIIDGLLAEIKLLKDRIKVLEDKDKAKNDTIKSIEKSIEKSKEENINNACTWSKILTHGGKKTQKTELQTNILNAVGNEQNERRKRERNVILFGIPNSKAATIEEKAKDDEQKVKQIFNQIGITNGEFKVQRFKANPSKPSVAPPPVRVNLGVQGLETWLKPEEVIKAAKQLKKSTEFKEVFIGLDLTESQIAHLKQLIKSRNALNEELNKLPTASEYYYGIRDDKVVKLRKAQT